MAARGKVQPFVLPDDAYPPWLPRDAWRDFEAARNEGKWPLTMCSTRAALRRLDKMRAQGIDIADVLDQATTAGWRGLFADERTTRQVVQDSASDAWHAFREAIRTDRMPDDGKVQRVIRKLGGLGNLGLKSSRDLDMLKPEFSRLIAGEAH